MYSHYTQCRKLIVFYIDECYDGGVTLRIFIMCTIHRSCSARARKLEGALPCAADRRIEAASQPGPCVLAGVRPLAPGSVSHAHPPPTLARPSPRISCNARSDY
jgi:hypothetical protein